MKNCKYIVYFTIFILLKNCSPECTHYYLVLNEYFERDLLKDHITPTTVQTIALDNPSFNSTEEFKELQDNEDCILEFRSTPSCPLNSTTLCLRQVPDIATEDSSNRNAVQVTTNNKKENYTTLNSNDYETTEKTANNSTNGIAAVTSKKAANDNMDTAKTVGIVAAGATGAAGLGYFITMKIKHILQYGAYHLP